MARTQHRARPSERQKLTTIALLSLTLAGSLALLSQPSLPDAAASTGDAGTSQPSAASVAQPQEPDLNWSWDLLGSIYFHNLGRRAVDGNVLNLTMWAPGMDQAKTCAVELVAQGQTIDPQRFTVLGGSGENPSAIVLFETSSAEPNSAATGGIEAGATSMQTKVVDPRSCQTKPGVPLSAENADLWLTPLGNFLGAKGDLAVVASQPFNLQTTSTDAPVRMRMVGIFDTTTGDLVRQIGPFEVAAAADSLGMAGHLIFAHGTVFDTEGRVMRPGLLPDAETSELVTDVWAFGENRKVLAVQPVTATTDGNGRRLFQRGATRLELVDDGAKLVSTQGYTMLGQLNLSGVWMGPPTQRTEQGWVALVRQPGAGDLGWLDQNFEFHLLFTAGQLRTLSVSAFVAGKVYVTDHGQHHVYGLDGERLGDQWEWQQFERWVHAIYVGLPI